MALANAKVELQKLDLSHNQLSGSVPGSVGEAICSLELLDLSWNKLSSPLPDSAWARGLHNLRALEMGHNAFNGRALPSVMWKGMRKVVGVGLAQAGLKVRISEALAQMRSLRYLDLSSNSFEGQIPATLEQGLLSIVSELGTADDLFSVW
ncbi:hypothetical protein L7F22_017493 [Adiantum nelumboides]|nr:hypothetical protein [Adiantum nelumboides]